LLGIDGRAARYTWTAALIALAILLVYLVRQTLFIFVIALLFAYLLYPLMDHIDRRLPGKTRGLGLLITFGLVIALLATFISVIGTVVVEQANALASAAPAFLERLRANSIGQPSATVSIQQNILLAIEGQFRAHYNEIVAFAPQATLRLLSASASLIDIIIVPILAFFILKDGREIRDSFLSLFDRRRHEAEDTLADMHTLLLQYMRALLFLCCATFVSFSIVLSAMGVPYSILLASIAFLLEFVPLVGPLAAALIIIGVSVASGFDHMLWVILYLAAYRMFQDYVLSPHLMSKGVELHPLLVIFGVFAGGEIGGVAGIFLSIPALALVRLLYHRLRKVRDLRWAETNLGEMRL
jgi:predicted PurR-regulated permease PerM